MKATPFLCFRAKLFLILICALPGYQALRAQTFIYDFESPVLKSGTNLAVGAVYLFSNVKTGTDAVVKITAISGGVTLGAIDNTSSGYLQAFQPTLNVPLATVANPKVNAYAEFSITFIVSGSYVNATTYTIQAQSNVPATALDIDGTFVTSPAADSLFEYDMLDLGTGSYIDYSTTGGQLVFNHTGTAYTGQTFTATNYSGIDVTALAVMFTVLDATLTTPLIFRTGIITELPAATASRVTSLAFFKPTYPHSILPIDPLTDFSGVMKNNAINLQWVLTPGDQLSTLTLQKAEGSDLFRDIQDFAVGGQSPDQFSYSDPTTSTSLTGNINYRLKMTTPDGISTFSNTLSFRANDADRTSFSITPTLISHTAAVNIAVNSGGAGVLRLEDYSGRELYRQALSLSKGSNIIPLNLSDHISPGYYLAVLQTNGQRYIQRIAIIR